MQLEDYFDFNTEPVEHIRIKGTRIDIAHVIELYKADMTPEQIAPYFGRPITVEQAYAAVTYYLANKERMESYLSRRDIAGREAAARYQASRTPEQRSGDEALRSRLKELKTRFTDSRGRLDLPALQAYLGRTIEPARVAG